jgi:hypothetical protein
VVPHAPPYSENLAGTAGCQRHLSHDTYEGYVSAPATGGAGVQPDCAEVDTVVVGSEVALAGRGVSSSATYYDADPV